MRVAVGLLGAILVFAFNAHAEINPNYTLPQVSPAPTEFDSIVTSQPAPMFALATPAEPAASSEPGPAATNASASSDSSAQQEPPSVYGVFQNYNWQIYAAYSLFRFYLVSKPNTILTLNGLDVGIVYFVPKFTWLGVEGQFIGEYGGFLGYTAKFGVGQAGLRYRWSAPHGLVLWAHGLIGGTKFVPRTAYGSETALAYEAGGGVDVGAHHRRIAYRLELDMVGTRYFNTYQYSPRISVGVVFKY